MRRALPAALLLLGLVAVPAHAAPKGAPCTDRSSPTPVAVPGGSGFVASPEKAPKGLVVFFHGYQHTAADWAEHHLERVAQESRVVTVAMDYPQDAAEETWQVQEGADVSVAATLALQDACRSVRTTVAYGVSMGGNASGLALADAPGVFDWWFDIEGANNVIETYLEASAVAVSKNKTAVSAV